MPLRWKKHLPNEGRKWRSPQSSQHAPRYLPKGGRRFTPCRPPSLLMLLLIGALKQGLKIKTLGGGGGGRVEVMGRREEEGEEEELLHQPDDVEVADAPAPELLDLALDGVEGLLLALGPGQGALKAPRLVVDGHVGPALLPLLLLLLHLHLDQQIVRGVAAVQQVKLHLEGRAVVGLFTVPPRFLHHPGQWQITS